LAKSAHPYDTRAEAAPGESRGMHFDDAVHRATFAAVIKARAHANDDLTFDGEPKGDD
jgi:hypothetical protein